MRSRLLPSLLVLWAFGVATARTLRLPNDFALAHWLLDYRLGFGKRRLLGSLAALLGGDPTIASLGLLALSATALLYALLRLAGRARDPAAWLVALVLASSPLAVMHAHLVGYLDGAVVALGVGAVALALRGRALAGASMVGIAVLMHEMALVLVLPAFLFAVGRRGGRMVAAALPALVAFAAVALAQVAQAPALQRAAIAARLAPHASLDPVIREALPLWLTEPFLENLRQCADGLWQRSLWAFAPLLVVPSLAVVLWYAWPRLRGLGERAVFLAICAAPEVAHLFAWDAPRIWTWSLFAALLAAWVVADTTTATVVRHRLLRPACVAALLINAGLTIPLMDSRHDNLPLVWRLLLCLPVVVGAGISSSPPTNSLVRRR